MKFVVSSAGFSVCAWLTTRRVMAVPGLQTSVHGWCVRRQIHYVARHSSALVGSSHLLLGRETSHLVCSSTDLSLIFCLQKNNTTRLHKPHVHPGLAGIMLGSGKKPRERGCVGEKYVWTWRHLVMFSCWFFLFVCRHVLLPFHFQGLRKSLRDCWGGIHRCLYLLWLRSWQQLL